MDGLESKVDVNQRRRPLLQVDRVESKSRYGLKTSLSSFSTTFKLTGLFGSKSPNYVILGPATFSLSYFLAFVSRKRGLSGPFKLTWINGSAPVTGSSAQILTDNNWFGQMCIFVYGKNWNLMFWIDFEKPFFFLFSFFDQIEILNVQWDSTNTSDDLNIG